MNEMRARHYAFFGREGQRRLNQLRVAVIGVGGTGSIVTQQLAYLGVGALDLIDPEQLDETNRGRYVTARVTDAIPGSWKVDLAARMVPEIDPGISVVRLPLSLLSSEAFRSVVSADAVLGCVDHDGVRFVLNELCVAYERPYFDVATGILPPEDYGGEVRTVLAGQGCLMCMGVLNQTEVDDLLMSGGQKAARMGIYGVPLGALESSGPSVISINGVVASLAVTEFMLWATGLRPPARRLIYRGNRGTVHRVTDAVSGDCYYCSLRGQRERAEVERYVSAHINPGGRHE
jgi:molybdopterin/thiamine biosynthesis adenylyltransferase